VWKTKPACFKGAATEALQAITEKKTPVILTFFPGDRQQLVQFLVSEKVPHFVIETGNTGEARMVQTALFVTDAFSLTHEMLEFLLQRSKSSGLRLLFLGHYPIPGPEDAVLEKITQRLGPGKATFCLSMDDGLMRHFGSDKIRPLMESLQIKDDESIEHAMVSKAIQRARERLMEEIVTESKTKTESEWFTRNVNQILN
jgi:preprotein translocase subunit SecA